MRDPAFVIKILDPEIFNRVVKGYFNIPSGKFSPAINTNYFVIEALLELYGREVFI